MMTEPTATDCAYAAGLIDGEGTIAIGKRPPRRGVPRRQFARDTYFLNAVVTNTVREPLDWLAERFAGRVYYVTLSSNRLPNGLGYYYRWSASHRLAADFLQRVMPYLIIKKVRKRRWP